MKTSLETHEFHFLKPRPSNEDLYKMVKNHFDLESTNYDNFDINNEKRRRYTASINQLIAGGIPKVKQMLSIACGTGRRDLEIRKLSSQNYELRGVEISPEMARIATENGIVCETSNWLDSTARDSYDAICFLYAFGAIPNSSDRLKSLKKAKDSLRAGAPLYIDVLNIDDQNEWGPKIREEFTKSLLTNSGYELGDILYSKIGDSRLAYWHYFSESEIELLLRTAGFEKVNIKYIGYGVNPGELVTAKEGAIFIEAR